LETVKIAIFYPRNFLACSYALGGYYNTLTRMGHEVRDCFFPGNTVQVTAEILAKMPTMEQLLESDLVISFYHEYTQPWLKVIYPFEQWELLMEKVPVLARFDESMDRGDLWLPQRVPELKKWARYYSFPAAQDAEKYGGEWLPYGADTTIFHPPTLNGLSDGPIISKLKKYDLGFIGSLYQQRHEYLMKLIQHVGAKTTFYSGCVLVQDLGGLRERETTELLAENYRQIRIFFLLPPMSRLLVEKTFDIMASDTLVMFPRFPGDAAKNLTIFKEETHIVYYELGFFANNGKQVKYYLEHPEECERIARAGGELVRRDYTLEGMLQKMIGKVMNRATVPSIAGGSTA